MPTYKPQYTITPNPWLDTYKDTLASLAILGKKFPAKTRLPIFKLYTEIAKLPDGTEGKEATLDNLTRLLELIKRGIEPKNQNGKYLK